MHACSPPISDPLLRRVRRLATFRRAVAASALLAVALTGAGVPAASIASASTTTKSPLPPALRKFAHCPVGNPNVSLCLTAASTGTFEINSTTLTESSPIVINLGLIQNPDGTMTVVLPDDGTPAMSAPPISVPGGLLGIPGASGPLAVTATPQLVGLPTFSLFNLETTDGPAISLPTDVLLTNPLLGTDCTVSSPSDPTTLNLTDGTTNPPGPNTPISGSIGKVRANKYGGVSTKGTVLVDNSFAVPGASGCGLLGVLDPIINEQKGLPSPAGTNSVTLTGNSELVSASAIRQYIES
jgi:hypothetical protein